MERQSQLTRVGLHQKFSSERAQQVSGNQYWFTQALNESRVAFSKIVDEYLDILLKRARSNKAKESEASRYFVRAKLNIILGAEQCILGLGVEPQSIEIQTAETQSTEAQNSEAQNAQIQHEESYDNFFMNHSLIYCIALAARSHIIQMTQAYNTESLSGKKGESSLIAKLDGFLEKHHQTFKTLETVMSVVAQDNLDEETLKNKARDFVQNYGEIRNFPNLEKYQHMLANQINVRGSHKNKRYANKGLASINLTLFNSKHFANTSPSLKSWAALQRLYAQIEPLCSPGMQADTSTDTSTNSDINAQAAHGVQDKRFLFSLLYLASVASARVTSELLVDASKARLTLLDLVSVALGLPTSPLTKDHTHSLEEVVYKANKALILLREEFESDLNMAFYWIQCDHLIAWRFEKVIDKALPGKDKSSIIRKLIENGYFSADMQNVGLRPIQTFFTDSTDGEGEPQFSGFVDSTLLDFASLIQSVQTSSPDTALLNPELEFRRQLLLCEKRERIISQLKYSKVASLTSTMFWGDEWNMQKNCEQLLGTKSLSQGLLADVNKLLLLVKLPNIAQNLDSNNNEEAPLRGVPYYREDTSQSLPSGSRIKRLFQDVYADNVARCQDNMFEEEWFSGESTSFEVVQLQPQSSYLAMRATY